MAGVAIILVVNADDFGLSEGINQGILSAHQHGILSSTSLMPNGAAFDGAVEIAKSNPDLGVGVHLSLVAERCIAKPADVRGLGGPDGLLPASYAAFVKSYITGRFGVREIRAEVEAQVKRVLDAGIRPTHLDSHQHVHVLPGFIDVVIETAKAAAIPVVRVPLERGGPGPGAISARGIQASILSLFSRAAKSKLHRAGIHCVDHFWGVGVSGRMNEANLDTVLRRLRNGTNEIMCHPGLSDPATETKYQWNYSWDDETAALQSDKIIQKIHERDIQLESFRDIWR